MNLKITAVGGIVYYIVTFILSMITGPLIHQGALKETYTSFAAFWRPELNAVPPDMAALLPLWITVGLIYSVVIAAIYSIVRPALAGSGWMRGVKYGVGLGLLIATLYASLYGVFNLPAKIWIYWVAEGVAMSIIGGAILGLVAEKLAPSAV